MNNSIKKKDGVTQYIFGLIFGIPLFLFVGIYFLKDIIFYITNERGTCTIISIDKNGTEEKPYRVKLIYHNKFISENVNTTIFVDENFKNEIKVNGQNGILYGRFFKKKVYFVNFDNLKIITVINKLFSLVFLFIAINFCLKRLKIILAKPSTSTGILR